MRVNNPNTIGVYMKACILNVELLISFCKYSPVIRHLIFQNSKILIFSDFKFRLLWYKQTFFRSSSYWIFIDLLICFEKLGCHCVFVFADMFLIVASIDTKIITTNKCDMKLQNKNTNLNPQNKVFYLFLSKRVFQKRKET